MKASLSLCQGTLLCLPSLSLLYPLRRLFKLLYPLWRMLLSVNRLHHCHCTPAPAYGLDLPEIHPQGSSCDTGGILCGCAAATFYSPADKMNRAEDALDDMDVWKGELDGYALEKLKTWLDNGGKLVNKGKGKAKLKEGGDGDKDKKKKK